MESKRIRVPAVSRLVTLSMITLGMMTLMLTAPGIAAGQNWVSTGTQAVGPVLANAISQGNLPDATPIHVNVGLQIKNRDALVNYVKRISTPGDALYLRGGFQERVVIHQHRAVHEGKYFADAQGCAAAMT
jgi:hypothetical protein